MAYVLLFILNVLICSCTQIALKKAAGVERHGIWIYLNWPVIISNVVFVGATLVTVSLYRYMQLSTATLLNSASFIFVPLLSAIFLKEKIEKRTILGIALIISGITIYAVFSGAM